MDRLMKYQRRFNIMIIYLTCLFNWLMVLYVLFLLSYMYLLPILLISTNTNCIVVELSLPTICPAQYNIGSRIQVSIVAVVRISTLSNTYSSENKPSITALYYLSHMIYGTIHVPPTHLRTPAQHGIVPHGTSVQISIRKI